MTNALSMGASLAPVSLSGVNFAGVCLSCVPAFPQMFCLSFISCSSYPGTQYILDKYELFSLPFLLKRERERDLLQVFQGEGVLGGFLVSWSLPRIVSKIESKANLLRHKRKE